jgi:hypothetical protein
VAEEFGVAMNWGTSPGSEGTELFRNSSGSEGRQRCLIKTLGSLQELRQKIYRKGKTEAIGSCVVDAGDIIGIESTSDWLRPIELLAN